MSAGIYERIDRSFVDQAFRASAGISRGNSHVLLAQTRACTMARVPPITVHKVSLPVIVPRPRSPTPISPLVVATTIALHPYRLNKFNLISYTDFAELRGNTEPYCLSASKLALR